MVAAGAIVPAGSRIKSNQIWAGHPAKHLRDLTAQERENQKERHHEYTKLVTIHSERKPGLSQTPRSPSEGSSTMWTPDLSILASLCLTKFM